MADEQEVPEGATVHSVLVTDPLSAMRAVVTGLCSMRQADLVQRELGPIEDCNDRDEYVKKARKLLESRRGPYDETPLTMLIDAVIDYVKDTQAHVDADTRHTLDRVFAPLKEARRLSVGVWPSQVYDD